MNLITLALVDDDKLITKLLSDFLAAQENLNVLFTALGGKEFLDKINQSKTIPDILLLDLNMKEMTGIELTKIIRKEYPSIKIIVISSHYKRNFTGFMIKTGVSAFLPKGIAPYDLNDIIQEVYLKGVYFLDEQLEIIRSQISAKSPKPILNPKNLLTEREMEVLNLICRQKTAQEIGKELFVTKRTVEGHKNNLFSKTGTKNMAGLVIYAVQNELIDVNDLPSL
ncbi:MAG: response regulator transcription factor [Bacteroidota bacterium]